MTNDTKQTIKQLVEQHFQQNGHVVDGEKRVPIAASHKLHWANEAGIDYREVETYLSKVCEPTEPDSEFQAVPNYRLYGDR